MSGKGAVGLDECMPKIVDVEGGGVGVLESGVWKGGWTCDKTMVISVG